MARNYGRISVTIWQNEEWLDLSSSAQRVYLLLLSQPTLTLAGVTTLAVKRWARWSKDGSPAKVKAAIDELERAGFIWADHDTEEVGVRSFTRHDIQANPSPQIRKGFWAAWSSIASKTLRSAVLAEMPDPLWRNLLLDAPPTALLERGYDFDVEVDSLGYRSGYLATPNEDDGLGDRLPRTTTAATTGTGATPTTGDGTLSRGFATNESARISLEGRNA